MKRAAEKIVPKLLNFKQKQNRMDIVQEMLTTFKDDPDPEPKKIIIGDESFQMSLDLWCFLFHKENVTLLEGALKKLLTNPVVM